MIQLPLFIAFASVSGAVGIGKSVKAAFDYKTANKTNKKANELIDVANELINRARRDAGVSLESLGMKKLYVLDSSMNNFIKTYEKLKNVDFKQSVGLNELSKIHIDKQSAKELKELGGFATSIVSGIGSGALGGAATAFGAYSAAGSLAAASTGTPIAALSGITAQNATLAFFGGGSIATGGLGIAGGSIVLGGLITGPALAIMGVIIGAKATALKEESYSNLAQAKKYSVEMEGAADLCNAISHRADMFCGLLSKLQEYFDRAIEEMRNAFEKHGPDYRSFSKNQKESVAAGASLAKAIKTVIDTPILSQNGNLTFKSQQLLSQVDPFLNTDNEITIESGSSIFNIADSMRDDVIPDLGDIVRSCCKTISVDSTDKFDKCHDTEICTVYWSRLVGALNEIYHLNLTPEAYTYMIHNFGEPEISCDLLISECRHSVFSIQASYIVESCMIDRKTNPLDLTVNDLDINKLAYKINKAYDIVLKLQKIKDSNLTLTKFAELLCHKVPENRMVLSHKSLNSIVCENIIDKEISGS